MCDSHPVEDSEQDLDQGVASTQAQQASQPPPRGFASRKKTSHMIDAIFLIVL
jgi:hypothetical protein